MGQYIDKAAIAAEIERMLEAITNASEQDVRDRDLGGIYDAQLLVLRNLAKYLDTIEVEEIQKKNLYVVTRCEEHSDYVENVFFSKEKAENYCKQFEGNEDAYGRDITEIEVDYPLEVKEVDSIWNDARKTIPEDSSNQIICIKEDDLAVATVGKLVHGTKKWAYLHDLLNISNVQVREVDFEKQDVVHGTVDYPLIGCDFPNIYPNYKELKEYCDRKGIKDNDKVKLIIIKDM